MQQRFLRAIPVTAVAAWHEPFVRVWVVEVENDGAQLQLLLEQRLGRRGAGENTKKPQHASDDRVFKRSQSARRHVGAGAASTTSSLKCGTRECSGGRVSAGATSDSSQRQPGTAHKRRTSRFVNAVSFSNGRSFSDATFSSRMMDDRLEKCPKGAPRAGAASGEGGGVAARGGECTPPATHN